MTEPVDFQIELFAAILPVATKPPSGASLDGQAVWLEVQQEFADSLASGRLQIAKGAGHYIHKDAPEMVIVAIRELLPQSTAGRSR